MVKLNLAVGKTPDLKAPETPMFYKVSLADKLAQSLVAEISRGSLKRGAQLPTETELCEIHGVSRITVRRALDALQRNGLIERIAGKGTFVTGRSKIAEWQLESIEDLIKFIADTRTDVPKILRWELVRPIAKARAFLGLSSHEKSYLMLAVRYIGKNPVYIVEAYLPRAIGDLIKLQDLSKTTPVELYETRLDMPPQRVVEEITVTDANAICAGPLGIQIGAPVVLHTLEFHGPDGPLQYVREWWHPKYFKRRYELNRR
ncbi:GntR family transcriptional regulator [Xanthobacter sp. KR7-65]|uniref:GntR family transcriptional regulator n=1 Tax=Xanthobacter sp. KR7-65 TaxID=3156612 RepID=UPI0032B46EF1